MAWKWAYSAVILVPGFFYHAYLSLNNRKRNWIFIFAYLQGFVSLIIHLNNGFFTGVKIIPYWGYYPQGNSIFYIHFIIWTLVTIFSHIEIFRLYKKATEEFQNGIFFFVSLVGYIGAFTNFLGFFNISFYPIGNFFIAIQSIIGTYAALRHQFLDIQIVIKKSIIYSVLISIISIVYLITVLISEKFLQGLVGYQSFLISGLLTFGLGLLFIPLKSSIERLVDHYFFKGSPEELSKQIEKFNQEVQQREKYKLAAQVVGNVAHEIKNPLTSIRTFIEQFPSKKNDPEFMDKFHKLTCNELERVQQLSLQLTDFARPEELKLSKFDIHACLDDVLMLVNNKLKHQDIRLVKQFVPGPLTLTADRDQIKQVFLNIVLNAIDAMQDGGTLTVETRVIARSEAPKQSLTDCFAKDARNDSGIEVLISDTGSGISPEHQKKLFEPFFTTKSDGTGLGLNICQRIIKGHGGKIEVKSEVNQGTTFSIIFPASKASISQGGADA